jgi:hypothetical protein
MGCRIKLIYAGKLEENSLDSRFWILVAGMKKKKDFRHQPEVLWALRGTIPRPPDYESVPIAIGITS